MQKGVRKKSQFKTNITLYLQKDTKYGHSYNKNFQKPCMIPNLDYKVTTFFNS